MRSSRRKTGNEHKAERSIRTIRWFNTEQLDFKKQYFLNKMPIAKASFHVIYISRFRVDCKRERFFKHAPNMVTDITTSGQCWISMN